MGEFLFVALDVAGAAGSGKNTIARRAGGRGDIIAPAGGGLLVTLFVAFPVFATALSEGFTPGVDAISTYNARLAAA